MSETKSKRTIEVNEDLRFTRKETVWQRVGWALMLIIVAAGLSGGLGAGALARASSQSSGFTLDYDRLARHGRETSLELRVPRRLVPIDTVRIWIDREFIEGAQITSLVPEPLESAVDGAQAWYSFATTGSDSIATITIQIEPDALWSRGGRIGVNGGESISFRQFVLP